MARASSTSVSPNAAPPAMPWAPPKPSSSPPATASTSPPSRPTAGPTSSIAAAPQAFCTSSTPAPWPSPTSPGTSSTSPPAISKPTTASRLFLMDYPEQARLKIIGHARIVELGSDPALEARVQPAAYRADHRAHPRHRGHGVRLELLPAHHAALEPRRTRSRHPRRRLMFAALQKILLPWRVADHIKHGGSSSSYGWRTVCTRRIPPLPTRPHPRSTSTWISSRCPSSSSTASATA